MRTSQLELRRSLGSPFIPTLLNDDGPDCWFQLLSFNRGQQVQFGWFRSSRVRMVLSSAWF